MPEINSISLTVSQGCGQDGGIITANASDSTLVPLGGQAPYVSIRIYGTNTQEEYYSDYTTGSASISMSGLPNDIYEVQATSTSGVTPKMEEVTIECVPNSDIAITPTYTTPITLVLDISSNLAIASDVYTGVETEGTILGPPVDMQTWVRNEIDDTHIQCTGVINDEELNTLTVTATVIDVEGFSKYLAVYWSKIIYTKQCGVNQSGSYTSVKTAFSTISMQDAINKATLAAHADADTNLQCDSDIKLREIQMVDKSFTVSYSLEGQCWSCFHDYIPDAIFCTANKVMSFKDQEIYIHNQKGRKGLYYNTDSPYRSQIEFVIANLLSKAYHAINWKSQHKTEGVIDERKTFTAVMIYNHNQCSGEQPITLKKTTRNAEGVWRFNEFRDLVKDPNTLFLDEKGNVIPLSIMANKSFFKQARFIGDYLCVRMIFDNAQALPEIVLSDFSINDKVSYR